MLSRPTSKTKASAPAKALTTSPAKYFGTDGIRGTANVAPLIPELAFKLGRAIAYVCGRSLARKPRVLIGKDTRLSGYMLETALASGVCASGGAVILCGPVPTPAIAHLTTSMRADAGIVISASHNPYEDNGIKIFGADGFKLSDELEREIEALLDGDDLPRTTGPGIGRATKLEDARGRYVVFAKNTFPSDLRLDGLRIAIDAAHGAAYRVAPLVFSELGATVSAIGVKPNGVNINKEFGALYPGAVRAEVVKKSADIGIALDGDADRLILVDEKGQVVDGDVVMALCARSMLAEKKLNKNTLVATIMSNLGLEQAMQQMGGKLVRTQVGDRYVVEAMRQGGYNLGGEQSGHLVFLDHASTGDGTVAALQVLAVMLRSGKPLSELARTAMHRVPQILHNVELRERRPLGSMKALAKASASVEKSLGKKGRLVIRWSGTEPKLRIMLEGPNEAQIRSYALELAEAAKKD
jgi:phosphoglucosamine mutase